MGIKKAKSIRNFLAHSLRMALAMPFYVLGIP